MPIIIPPDMIVGNPNKNLVNNNVIRKIGFSRSTPSYDYMQKNSIKIIPYDHPGVVNKVSDNGKSYAILGSSLVSDFTNIISNTADLTVLQSDIPREDNTNYRYACIYKEFINEDISDNNVNKIEINYKYANQSGIMVGSVVTVVPWVYNNEYKSYENIKKYDSINHFFNLYCNYNGDSISSVKSGIGYDAGSMNFIFGIVEQNSKLYLCAICEIMEYASSDSSKYEKALLELNITHHTKCLKYSFNNQDNQVYDFSLNNSQFISNRIGRGNYFTEKYPVSYTTDSLVLSAQYFYDKYSIDVYGNTYISEDDKVTVDPSASISYEQKYYRKSSSLKSNQIQVFTNFTPATFGDYTGYNFNVYIVDIVENESFEDIKNIISDNIIDKFYNGKQTISFIALYGKYFDENGNIIYNNINGEILKINDEILPQKIKGGKVVPFSTKLDGSAKTFIIYDVEFVYPGDTIACKAIENI